MKKDYEEFTGAKHWHYQVTAFNGFIDEAKTRGKDGVNIEIIDAKSEEEAIEKAKEKVDRTHFNVRQIRECITCGVQREQKKAIEKLTEIINRNNEE